MAPGPAHAARVFLRAPRRDDGPAFLGLVRASRSLHHPWVDPPDDSASFRSWAKRASSRRCAGCLVCLCGSGRIVGVANLNDLRRDARRDAGSGASLGFYAFAGHTGRGYVTEGAALLLARGFDELGLARVTADVRAENRASLAALSRLGFRRGAGPPRLLCVGGAWREHERWQLDAAAWRAAAGPHPVGDPGGVVPPGVAPASPGRLQAPAAPESGGPAGAR